jgi:tetratricopeptide (TPR) repeat protein
MDTLARAHRSLGRFDKAASVCEEALAAAMQGRYGPGGGVGRRITELLIAIYYEAGRVQDAVATHEKLALAVTAGNSPQELNNFAWAFATSPQVELRNPARAVEFASKAVQLAPWNGAFHNTLGVAQYRAGNYKAAIETLTKSMGLSRSGDAADRFFLAMAEWQLGNKPAARTWFGEALYWMEKQASTNAELIRFRTEAAELLGEIVPPSTRPATTSTTTPTTSPTAPVRDSPPKRTRSP